MSQFEHVRQCAGIINLLLNPSKTRELIVHGRRERGKSNPSQIIASAESGCLL